MNLIIKNNKMNSDGEKDIIFLNDIINKIEIANVTSNPKELNDFTQRLFNIDLQFDEEDNIFYFTKQGCIDTYIYLNLLNDSIKNEIIWSYDYIPICKNGNNLIYFNNSKGNIEEINILLKIKNNFDKRKFTYIFQRSCAKSIRENYLYTNMNDKDYIEKLMSSKKKLCEETAYYALLTTSAFWVVVGFAGIILKSYFFPLMINNNIILQLTITIILQLTIILLRTSIAQLSF